MASLNSKQICIIPWTHYTLTHNTITTCCWRANQYSFQFPDYDGPWKKNMWLTNPKMTQQRKDMLEKGISGCPEICLLKNNMPTVIEQLQKMAVNEQATETCNKIACQIKNDICDEEIYPMVLGISAGIKCNHNCSFCCVDREKFQYVKQNPTDQEFENIKPLYQNCVDFRTCGGDTFAQTDSILHKMYDPIWNVEGLKAGVITNGAGLTLKRYEKFCVNGPIKNIHISFDSLNPENYQILHGRPLHVMYKNFTDITDKYNEHSIKMLSLVATTINLHELPDLVELAIEKRVPSVFVRLVINRHLIKRNVAFLYPYEEGAKKKMLETYYNIKPRIEKLQKNNPVKVENFDVLEESLKNA